MKKISLAILAFIYLGVSTGIAMNIHYCMGKISSIDMMHSKDKCGKCGMKQGNGSCCKDEFKIIKLSDAHKLIANEVRFFVPIAAVNNHSGISNTDLVVTQINFSNNINSPPDPPGISLNILHCVFRI
ncbi:MAG: hypothetical protein ABIN97_01230 [Ginsengibacter sp.]